MYIYIYIHTYLYVYIYIYIFICRIDHIFPHDFLLKAAIFSSFIFHPGASSQRGFAFRQAPTTPCAFEPVAAFDRLRFCRQGGSCGYNFNN